MTVEISLDDFATGVIAGLAAEGYRNLSLQGLDNRLVAAYDWLCTESARGDYELTFSINLNGAHGQSPDGRHAIRIATSYDLVHFYGNVMYIKIAPSFAYRYLEDLPGGEDMWRRIVRHMFVSDLASAN